MIISKKSRSKSFCENSKESSNTTTNATIEEQLNEFKRKNKEEYYKYKQNFCSDAGEKDEHLFVIFIFRKEARI